MAVFSRSQSLILPVAPLAATVIGVLTAAMFALVPTDLLESMVVDSGIASVLSAAEPPLGLTARLVLVLLCGGGIGLMAWFALFLTFGARTIVIQRSRGERGSAPVLRRADAHPVAPARRPLFANTDLGTPFLDVRAPAVPVTAPAAVEPPVERPLPVDLEQPLAAYGRVAVPETPLSGSSTPAREGPVTILPAERPQTFDPGERFETFPLTPMVRSTPQPVAEAPVPPVAPARADPSDTIHALLDRLERVVGQRPPATPPPPQETLEDTLAVLRRMATGAR
jgi:hypothetical protein